VAALTNLWGSGFVEPVVPPPHPRHIAAQQFLALALQEGQFGSRTWREWWGDLAVMADGQEILDHLTSNGFLDEDSGMLFIGPQAERHFGRRNFMDLLAVFTADPEMKVLHGRRELGGVSPLSVTGRLAPGEPRLLVLAGRTWLVTSIDWRRRTINVAEHAGAGRSRWSGGAPDLGFELMQSVRQVLLGGDPPVELSRRGVSALDRIRAERAADVDQDGTVLQRGSDMDLWWTFAGTKANSSLAAALGAAGIEARSNAESVTLRNSDVAVLRSLKDSLSDGSAQLTIDQAALDGLKFSAALPQQLAVRTLAERGSNHPRASSVAEGPIVVN
jgi:ATP-dependent Lhr-like helicase